MSPRRLLTLTLTPVFLALAGIAIYLVIIWPRPPLRDGGVTSRPRPPLRDDGKEPVSLRIDGMPGIRMYLHPKDKIIAPWIRSNGKWEAAETDLLLRTLKPGETFVDAGANVGYYTLLGSRLVGDRGKVYAFEPEPENFALLEKNVSLNGLTNVVLERKALSNRKGVLRLYIADWNKGDHRVYQPEGESRPSVEVEAVRLDEYFQGLGRRIDVLKTDTQGADGMILEGMKGLLEGQTDGPTIFMEFWPHALQRLGTDPLALLKTLQSCHYRIYSFRDHVTGLTLEEPEHLLSLYPVNEPQPQTDLMLLRGDRSPPKG